MRRNVGEKDRTVRILLGIALLAVSFLALGGALAVIGYVVGGVALVTGLVRFCPTCALAGIDTSSPRESDAETRRDPTRGEPGAGKEPDRPGDLVYVDSEPLARFEPAGHPIYGHRRRVTREAGREYLFVCVDAVTGMAYAEVQPDSIGITAANFLQRAVRWFRPRGVAVDRVVTGNRGWSVTPEFEQALRGLDLRRLRAPSRPTESRTSARRFIHTARRQWAYRHTYYHSRERAASLEPFLASYNSGGRPPVGAGAGPQRTV